MTPVSTPSERSTARCSRVCGIGAVVGGDDQQEDVDAAGAGDHRPHQLLVPRHVDQAEAAGAEVERGEAELDRDPPPALLGQPVGLAPGQRAHQGRLAVIDVAGGADRERHPAHSGERLPHRPGRLLAPRRRSSSAGRARPGRGRSGRSPAALGGAAARAAARRPASPGSTTQTGPSSSTPGSEPPPGAPASRSTSAAAPIAVASLRARAASSSSSASIIASAGTAAAPPSRWARRVPSSAASCSLSRRIARASGWRRQRSTASRRPARMPACGPPSSLSAEQQTTSDAGRDRGPDVGSPRIGSSAPEPRSSIIAMPRSRARPASSAASGCSVKPTHAEVGLVDAEDRARALADRVRVVGEAGAVGRPDLDQPGSGLGEDVRDPEGAADLDQLAAADDDLAVAPPAPPAPAASPRRCC